MNKKKLLLALAICAGTFSYANVESNVLYGNRANKTVNGADVVRLKNITKVPNYVKFKPQNQLPLEKLNSWLTKFYSEDYNYGLNLISSEKDNLGYIHYRYKQTINNYPVRLSMYIAHTKNGMIESVNGEILDQTVNSLEPSIGEEDALQSALNYVGAYLYKWEVESEEKHLKWATNNLSATYLPKGELSYVHVNGNIENELRLAYMFNIYAQEPMSRQEVYVDAVNGEILWTENKIHHVDEVGTAETAYSGLQTMTSDNNGGTYRLRESGRGNGIRTFNCNYTTNYSNTDFTNNTADWDLPGIDAHATDAHWGAEMTYDYFMDKHGRNSIDANGFALLSYVHYDQNYGNAFWDGQRMTYGDGSSGNAPFTALDIAGHEITHGLTTFTANLVYQSESGALNESFSDIFGVAVEYVARPNQANWVMGEDLGGTGIRNMQNPNSKGDPDTYFGDFWADLAGGDNGGVHTNSGVQNFWYVLLVDGGTGTNDNGDAYTVNALGLDTASAIAFRNLTVYLTTSSEYADARFYAIQSTIDMYGACTDEVKEVTNAWYAVGVGGEYLPYAKSDFEACLRTSCTVPFTVDFTNNSVNGNSFNWDFGDGNTSGQLAPSHTYTSYGTYAVELITDGGPSCGMDTLTQVAYITIDSNEQCTNIMPTAGLANTNECSGTLYDSGGPCGIYGANQDATYTIAPTGAGQVNLEFVLFDIEQGDQGGATCNYDNMHVYDGPNTNSPLIDIYCNNNPPPTTLSSSGSAITIRFQSDPGLEESGFEINWTCDVATAAPKPEFIVDADTTCTGEVNFTDLSTNGPISWAWDFGDGNTSTDQHPSHVYTQPGLYTVELVATNNIGSGTEVKTDFIYIDMPDAPSVQGDSICTGNTATLTANGDGQLSWYDSPSSTTPLTTGSSYTTPVLTNSTTYYVEDKLAAQLQSFAKTDNTGGGGYLDNEQYLVFDAYQEMFIQTVKVYAGSSGTRTIQLKDENGTILKTRTTNINQGEQTVYLLFPVDPGVNYQLVLADGSSVKDLYRNNSGVVYPYTLAGIGSVTNSSAGSGFYYYFYDWQVKGPDCTSPRVPVEAEVNLCTGLDQINNGNLNVFFDGQNALEIINGTNQLETYHLTVTSSLGQVIHSAKITMNGNEQKSISLNDVAKGMYLVNLSNGEGNHVIKFIK